MRHQSNKFKLRSGKDANDMLLRKLIVNFVAHGTMVTTEKKGKALSSYMGKLVEKAKSKTEANKNYLLQKVSSKKMINAFFNQIGPTFKDVKGGYIALKRLQQRYSDGATMVKLSWVKPVVIESPSTEEKAAKTKSVQVKVTDKKKSAPIKKAQPIAKKAVKKA